MSDVPGALPPKGAAAIIFISLRTEHDDAAYGAAAEQMIARGSAMPGYLGLDSARAVDGIGITISYWTDEASALAWKADAEHAAIRELGRERWYAHYRTIVTTVERAYGWVRDASE